MKKILLLTLISFAVFNLHAQTLSTARINDWNKIPLPGFYDCIASDSKNIPYKSEYQSHFLGINIGLSSNSTFSTLYSGQLLFSINYDPNAFPNIYVRSTNVNGEGKWARLLHSKGNHAIDGKLTAKEIEIKVNTGADFVFKPDYDLKPLSEVESFVKQNQHLPEIPSEKEMKEKGLNVSDMQIKLLQKIEELTLYMIDIKKENELIKQELKILKKE